MIRIYDTILEALNYSKRNVTNYSYPIGCESIRRENLNNIQAAIDWIRKLKKEEKQK